MDRPVLSLPRATQRLDKLRTGTLGHQLTLYIWILLIAALLGYGIWVRKRSIFACPASGYTTDRYISYCHAANYGDYEHGAFWFDLESTSNFARTADVLFLGNSRMQKAFSTSATADWFSAASARYYLMGFSYGENVSFAEALLGKMHPQGSVFVINIDDFFDRIETPPTKAVLSDPQAQSRYEGKRLWQRVHQRVCTALPTFCGATTVTFRSRETGAYDMEGSPPKIVPVSFDEFVTPDAVDRETATASEFLKQFAKGKCVILTVVPRLGTKVGDARAVAAALGMKLVTPDVAEELDGPSAERWSQAFFRAAGLEIRSCIAKHGAAAS